ncbi:YdgA family protein [Marinomonas ostreistagni]|uniref:YdgA family protein n=1 Tax=Marinomonas ostreistagni TaxID=359209 RepID=UPI00194EF796|nr:DUF945 family protein [Marinomonas ostreistagni]MBM6550907.1 DUF945 family protein [Marinomonas ostreistagni]
MNAKVVAALGAGCALALVVVPPMFIKSHVAANLAEIQASFNAVPGQELTLEKQEDGWFGASYTGHATVNLRQLDPSLADLFGPRAEVPFTLETAYGPLLFADGFGLGLAKQVIEVAGEELPEEFDWDQDQPLYQASVTTPMFGGLEVSDRVVPFTITDKRGRGSVEFSGYQGSGSFSDSAFDYAGEIDSLSISDRGEALTMSGYTFDIDSDTDIQTMIETGIAQYDMSMHLEQMAFTEMFSVSDIELSGGSDVDEEAQTTSGSGHFSMADLSVMNFPTVEELTFDMTLNDFSNEFLTRFNDFNKELSQAPSYQQDRLLTAFMMENLELLMSTDPSMKLEALDASFEQGDVHFEGFAEFLNGANFDSNNLNSPDALAQMVQAGAEFEIDEALAETLVNAFMQMQLQPQLERGWMTQEEFDAQSEQATRNMLESFIAQGWIVKDGDAYTADFELENGQMAFNGQAMNL